MTHIEIPKEVYTFKGNKKDFNQGWNTLHKIVKPILRKKNEEIARLKKELDNDTP